MSLFLPVSACVVSEVQFHLVILHLTLKKVLLLMKEVGEV